MTSAPILTVRNLNVTFATPRGPFRAVDGLNLELCAGEVLGLVGESGSGKSVSLRAILRLLRANATVTGDIRYKGEDLLAMPARAMQKLRGAGIGMIFQEPMTALNPVLRIGTQIEESLAAHSGRNAAARRDRAVELLQLVGIPAPQARLSNYPHEFSGGMRQRAMIAIALAAEPSVLLADEPTTALDVTIQDQILKLLKRLAKDLGMAMVLVTHDLGVVAQTCDRVSVMYAGRLTESAPVAELFARPRHAYTWSLLRSVPHGGQARTRLDPIKGQPPRQDAPREACAFAPRCGFAMPACTTARPLPVEIAPRQSTTCLARDILPDWRAR